MGTQEFVLGLGVDSKGEQRPGVCCKEGLRCIFKEPFVGTCEDPNLYAPCDPVTGCGGTHHLLVPKRVIVNRVFEFSLHIDVMTVREPYNAHQ